MSGQNLTLPDLIPARMLNEYVYCPRLCYLEWVQGEFVDNPDTLEGRFQHRRVDKEKGEIDKEEGSDSTIHASSVMLSGQNCGLIARIDMLEVQNNAATPVEYKRGKVPDVPGNVWEPDLIQLCAQGMILKENDFICETGLVYYVESKQKVQVELNGQLIEKALTYRDSLLSMATSGEMPPPLVDSPKCPRCSLVGICLPDEVNLLQKRAQKQETRRLVPARTDALPLYVQFQGAMIGKKGDELEVRQKGAILSKARLIDVSQVSVFGSVQISTQVTRELLSRNIPLCYFTYGGWFIGYTTGLGHKNVELRLKQFETTSDKEKSLALAKSFVIGKIKNARTLLRRNHSDPPTAALKEMSRLASAALHAKDTESLLGFEGAAAKTYFANFATILRPKEKDTSVFEFQNRNRRPPTDPVNALLSFLYAILIKDTTIVLQTIGYDPFLGFYHRPRYGRPALALDLAEEFRPLIADSVVLSLINTGEIRNSDFIKRAGAVALTDRGRKQVLASYERRMDTLITHPTFGYSISYRRVLEVQARLLGRYLFGELDSYQPFVTR